MPRKEICWTPQELIQNIVRWKKNKIHKEDNDQVWCIFDVDDFYKNDKDGFLKAIDSAKKNDIKIAYVNECFELWILLHFEIPTFPIKRGNDLKKRIQKIFKKRGLGSFKKNQKVFQILLPFQSEAVKNAKKILPHYEKINWKYFLSKNGNPSTSIHFLIEEINKLLNTK